MAFRAAFTAVRLYVRGEALKICTNTSKEKIFLVLKIMPTVNFLKKNDNTIPSLRYRIAKELTVRLYGLVKTIFLKVLRP